MKHSLAHWFSDTAHPGKANRLVLAALILLPAFVFAPAANYEFVEWDDNVNITANPHVSGLGWDQLKWMFTDVRLAHRYMPLGWLCYAVERTVWGQDPFIFHLGNIVLHTINTLLLFSLLKRIFSRFEVNPGEISVRVIAASGMGALLWSLHPLRTEVVSWCASRIYLMATLWFLLSVLSYLQATTGSKHSRRWLWASFVFFAASLLTYPIILLGAVTFVCLDLFVLHRQSGAWGHWLSPTWKQVWLEKVPFFLISGVCLGVTVVTRTAGQSRGYLETLEVFDLQHRIAQGFYGWAYYAWIHAWPFDLAPRYGALLSFDPTEAKFLASAALVIGLTGWTLWWSRRWPVLLGLWVCHLLLYLPFIGLTEHPHSTYDRYTYVPGMLWAVAVATLLWKLWPKVTHRSALFACGGLLACGLVALSSHQTLVWQNTSTVRLRIAENFGSHPDRAVHEEVAGRYFLSRRMLEPARECFQRALQLDPEDVDFRIYLGDTLAEMGRVEDAFIEYRRAAEAKPRNVRVRHNLGVAFCKLGRYHEGAAVFREILKDDPAHSNARHNLAVTLQKIALNPMEKIGSSSTQETGIEQ